MALRLVMVALVALMSFELPSGRDLAAWSESGSHWIDSRVADLAQVKDGIANAFVGLSQAETAAEPASLEPEIADELALLRSDLAFEAAMDRLAIDFRADLAATDAALPVAEEAPAAVASANPVTPVAEDAEPVCLDRAGEPTEVAMSSLVTPAEPVAPVDRLSSAVRLTREALSAWASLIATSGDRDAEETR